MNKLKCNLNFYSNYFKGFNDIAEHKSAKQLGLGALKVASYITVLIPIIFAVGYRITKSRLDKLSNLCNRVSKFLDSNSREGVPTQDAYIKFLATKIQDSEYDHYPKAFIKLKPKSQGAFFATMVNRGTLREALKQTPKEVTEIEINLGKPKSFDKATRLIEEDFLTQLPSFKNLKTMVVDLSEIAFYSKKVKSLLEHMLSMKNEFRIANYGGKGGWDVYSPSPTYGIANNIEAALTALSGLSNHLKQTDKLKKIEIRFKNQAIKIKKDENTALSIE